jgi:hypothetical protein
MRERVHLIAESGKPKEILEAWRRDWFAAEERLQDFMREIGANACFRFGFEKPVSFRFLRNAVPDGWTKPGSNGASRPKKVNTEMRGRIDALAWCADLKTLVQEAFNLPLSMSYKSEHGEGTRYLSASGPNFVSACWTAGPDGLNEVILIIPDYDAASAGEASVTWHPEGSSPGIPEGFRKVTEAEVELLFAESKVARERAKREEETPAEPGF